MREELKNALTNEIWIANKIGDRYQMDSKDDLWAIGYYPIFCDNKTKEIYNEPRALVEKPILGKWQERIGTEFREVPLRYLTKVLKKG